MALLRNGMDILRLQNVSKNYSLKGETIQVLQGIDLTIRAGEFLALMGPSGSGKTTLLHIMGGVDEPTEGKVFLGNQELSGLSPGQLAEVRLHRLGFIFQSYNLLPALTVFDNCAYPLILQGRPGKERRERVVRMLDRVGLSHRLKHRPEDLSGGEQQRVAVARALITRPLLVLADEPTAHLDAETGREIIDLLHRLNEEEGTTFLFATHDPALLQETTRILRLRGGCLFEN
jgi:putative ABC transport system ATP-binding protein